MYTKIKSSAAGFMQIFFGALLIFVSIVAIQKHWSGILLLLSGIFIVGLVDLVKINMRTHKIYHSVGFLTLPLGSYKDIGEIDNIFVSSYTPSQSAGMRGASVGTYEGKTRHAVILKNTKNKKFTLAIYKQKTDAESAVNNICKQLQYQPNQN
jgi:hypothetical protein